MSREECVQFLLESKTSFNDPFFSDRFLLLLLQSRFSIDEVIRGKIFLCLPVSISSSPIFNQFPAARSIGDRSIKQRWIEILFFPFRSPFSFEEGKKNFVEIKSFILFLFPFFLFFRSLSISSFDFSDSFFENSRVTIENEVKKSSMEWVGFVEAATLSSLVQRISLSS